MMSPSTSRLLGSFTRCIAALLRAPATPAPPVLGCRAKPICEPLRLSGLAHAGNPRSLSGSQSLLSVESYSYDGISPRYHQARSTGSRLNLPPPDQFFDRHWQFRHRTDDGVGS